MIVNWVGFVPPSVPGPMPVRFTLPLLVSVKTWAGQPVPVHPVLGTVVAVHVAGVRPAATTGATPVPVSATGEPLTATLAAMVAVPVFAPVEVGENTMLIVQLTPAASVAVQVPPAPPVGRENCVPGPPVSVATTTLIPVAPAVPVLDSVRVCAALVPPAPTLPKATDVGVTLSTAVAPPPPPAISTAPASTALLVLRAVP